MVQVTQSVTDGIERVTYIPAEKKFETPILMQHGMWCGAWCWAEWQRLLAEWGWESQALSLPGHAGSPIQRPIRWCTLGYYLEFLAAEIKRMQRPPVLIGHSMGGALTQMVLKKHNNLPAAILVAPWLSHSMMVPILRTIPRDPGGFMRCLFHLTTTPLVRNPDRTGQMFINDGAIMSAAELHEHVGPESLWVLFQYNPPLWRPAKKVNTPLLWLAGAADRLINEAAERRSAAHYGATYMVVPAAGHNIMMEKNYRETAVAIHDWLLSQNIP